MQSETQKPSKQQNTKRTYRSKLKKSLNFFQSTQTDHYVSKAIQLINKKIAETQIKTLQPPYFEKTLTNFRKESYSYKLKSFVDHYIETGNFEAGRNLLREFIVNFDDEKIDFYVEQIKQPYLNKILNENYQTDKVNFKELNRQKQTSFLCQRNVVHQSIWDALNETSEWLILMEVCEDLLNRINLYFNVPYQPIMKYLKNQGSFSQNESWLQSFSSWMTKTSFTTLKQSSILIGLGLGMLTWEILSEGNTVCFTKVNNVNNAVLTGIMSLSTSINLRNYGSIIEKDYNQTILLNMTEHLKVINSNIRKFNQLLENEINSCVDASDKLTYELHVTNLKKYIDNLLKDVKRVSKYDESNFEEMRERTKAYFKEYVEIQEDDEWVTVLTPENYEKRKAEIESEKSKAKENKQ